MIYYGRIDTDHGITHVDVEMDCKTKREAIRLCKDVAARETAMGSVAEISIINGDGTWAYNKRIRIEA